MTPATPLLAVDDVSVVYGRRAAGRAVDGVSLEIGHGESVGLVGESGCGKSSLARTIVRLQRPASGSIVFNGQDLASVSQRRLRRLRKGLTLVFQDPATSFNPRRTIRHSLREALRATRGDVPADADAQLEAVLAMVGIGAEVVGRFPHQMSGGQLQRVSIARALLCDPELIVLDEPVSALDVSVQAQIIEILARIRREQSVSMLFIAHDLAVVRQVCERVLIMYLGRVVEAGRTADVFDRPRHPYTRALLAAVPVADPAGRDERRGRRLRVDISEAASVDAGCRFAPRCWRADDRCLTDEPTLVADGPRSVACHHAEELDLIVPTSAGAGGEPSAEASPPEVAGGPPARSLPTTRGSES